MKIRLLFVEKLSSHRKPIEPQQPIRLVKPVLPQQRRLGGLAERQQGSSSHRDISGKKHPFQLVFPVQPLGQTQESGNRCPALPLRSSGCSVPPAQSAGRAGTVRVGAVALAILPDDIAHRGLRMVRFRFYPAPAGQQAVLRGQLDVDADAVRQKPQPRDQPGCPRRGSPWRGYIPETDILLAEWSSVSDHLFAGVVRVAHTPLS